VDPTNVVLK